MFLFIIQILIYANKNFSVADHRYHFQSRSNLQAVASAETDTFSLENFLPAVGLVDIDLTLSKKILP